MRPADNSIYFAATNSCGLLYINHARSLAMIDKEYPIQAKLDELIQNFKTFQTVSFPRGIPQPQQHWRPLLQALTQYDAKVAQAVSFYLCGSKVELEHLPQSPALEPLFLKIPQRGKEAEDFFNKLTTYKRQIDSLASILDDCAQNLGNPCLQIKVG